MPKLFHFIMSAKAKSGNRLSSCSSSVGSNSTASTIITSSATGWVKSTNIHLGGHTGAPGNDINFGTAGALSATQAASIFPSHRIEPAVESELLAKDKILALQVTENVKLNKEINLLTAEIEALRSLVEKKQVEINRLNNIVQTKTDTIAEQVATIKSLELDKRAFKLMEDQNKLLFEKLQTNIKDKDEMSGVLRKTLEEDNHLKTFGSTKLKSSVEVEVKLTAKLVAMEAALSRIATEKDILEARNDAMQKQVAEVNKQFLFIKDTSDDKITRSRQTEYKTLQKINELTVALQEAKDENEVIHESFQLACERGDMLQKRIQKAVDSSNNSFVLLNTVVDHIEEKYAEKVKEMKILRMKAAKLQMNYNVSRKAVDIMIKKDKIHNRNDNLTITMGRAANMSKRSTEDGFNRMAPENMLNITSNDTKTNTAAASTGPVSSSKLGVSFASTLPNSPSQGQGGPSSALDNRRDNRDNRDKVSDIIAIAPSEIEHGRKKLLSRYLQYCIPIAPTIDLSNCQITDEDMPNIIEWLRVLTCKASQEIVFRNNKITEIGFRLLMIWMIAMSREELLRSKPLFLDLRYNLISDEAILSSLSQIKSLERKEISLTTTERDNKIIVIYAPSGMILDSINGVDDQLKSRSRKKREDSNNANTFGNQCVVRIDCRHNDVGGNSISLNALKKQNLLRMGISDSIYDNKLLYSGTPLDTLTPSKLKMKPESFNHTGKSLTKSASAVNLLTTSSSSSAMSKVLDIDDDASISSNITDFSSKNNKNGDNKNSNSKNNNSGSRTSKLALESSADTNAASMSASMSKYVEYHGEEIEPSDITLPRDGIMNIRPEFIELFPIHQKY